MAVKTKEELKAAVAATYFENDGLGIKPDAVRALFSDLIDSIPDPGANSSIYDGLWIKYPSDTTTPAQFAELVAAINAGKYLGFPTYDISLTANQCVIQALHIDTGGLVMYLYVYTVAPNTFPSLTSKGYKLTAATQQP